LAELRTIVEDIYNLFTGKPKFHPDRIKGFAEALANKIQERMEEEQGKPALRMSQLGTKCDRQLWYKINVPGLAEALPPEARIKFLFGDILEEFLLFLAEEAGHEVVGRQDTLSIEGVKGHRDAIIDGTLVDAKSASSYSYTKFDNHLTWEDDSFGYIDQLGGYLEAGKDDPLQSNKDEAAFLVIDKTLGKITLDIHPKRDVDYKEKVREKKAIVNQNVAPPRAFFDKPEGKSGNRKLGIECSYCSFKQTCWPALRTFYYSKGPVYLTHVEREPKVGEQ
jgi:hypothetical protein